MKRRKKKQNQKKTKKKRRKKDVEGKKLHILNLLLLKEELVKMARDQPVHSNQWEDFRV